MANLDFTAVAVEIKENGPINAIKMIRNEYGLSLITSKCLMEIIRIIQGDIICPKCNILVDREQASIPKTLQKCIDERR